MKFKPLGDNVLVRLVEMLDGGKDAKIGSLFLPDTSQKKASLGEVMEVGPGKINKDGETVAIKVKKGDKVIFSEFASRYTFDFNGHNYLVLREDDVLLVIEK